MNKVIKKLADDDLEEVDQDPNIEANNTLTDELLSQEINDIISHTPHWLIRYGVSFIGMMLLLLMLGCWFIPYSDKRIVSIQIMAESNTPTMYGEIILSNAEA